MGWLLVQNGCRAKNLRLVLVHYLYTTYVGVGITGVRIVKRLLLLTLMTTLVCMSCSFTNSAEVVIAYLRAHNSHDPDQAMAYWSDSTHYEMVGEWSVRGIIEIRRMEELDAALHSVLDGSDYVMKGDTVIFDMVETTDWLTAAGFGILSYHDVQAIVREGKIVEFRITRDPAIGEKIEHAYSEVILYAQQQERHSALDTLLPEGQFIYTAETALLFVELTKEWRAAQEVEAEE